MSRFDVRLIERLMVDENLPALYFDGISRKANHSLDERHIGILRVPEHHDFTPLYGTKMVDELVDQNALAIGQLGVHAGALNLECLYDIGNEQRADHDGDGQIMEQVYQVPKGRGPSLRGGSGGCHPSCLGSRWGRRLVVRNQGLV